MKITQWKIQNLDSHLQQKIKPVKTKIRWTGTTADLVELIYALIETKHINEGEIDLNEAVDLFCTIFSYKVKDCYDTFRAIRRRVGKDRTHFIDEMKEKLLQRMDDLDNGIFKKKKIRQ